MKHIIFTIAFILTTGIVCAQKPLTSEIKEKIKTQNSKVTTISCRFKQTKRLAIMNKEIVTMGDFYYQQSDKLSMQFDNPKGDAMTMNGSDFLMITKGKRKVASSKNNAKLKTLQIMLTACMQGDIDAVIAHTSAKATYTEEGKNYVITLTPKAEQNKKIHKIVLTVSKQSMEIVALRIDETVEDYTIYELTNKTINKPIDPKVFEIKS